ncbi:hypothetical protein GCM10027610_005530 [Dactylosporangium cerinum]
MVDHDEHLPGDAGVEQDPRPPGQFGEGVDAAADLGGVLRLAVGDLGGALPDLGEDLLGGGRGDALAGKPSSSMTYVVRIEACRRATLPSADQICSSLQVPSGRSQVKERLASHSRSGGNRSMSRQTDNCPTVAGYVSSPDKVRLQDAAR